MRESVMISAFSSTLNGTLIHLLCAWISRETSRSHYSMQRGRSLAILFNGNLCANLGHPLSDLLSLFLGDRFFNGLGSLVNDCLRLFEAQACNLAHNFDDVDLVGTNLGEDSIKLGLFLNRGCGRRGFGCNCYRACCGCHGCSAHAPLLLQSLGQLYQFQYVQLLNFGNDGIYGHVSSSPCNYSVASP